MKQLLLLLLLIATAFTQSTENAGYSTVTLKISGYSPKPQVLYIPQNDARQSVDYGKLPVQTDQYGNYYLTVEGNYSFVFTVAIDASKPSIFMDKKFPPTEKLETPYLQNDSYIQSSDTEVMQRALDATRNSRTFLQAMRDLTLWVNSYLKYDLSYWDKMVTSSEALALKKGVCDEFTNVYTAMARSLGMPTRITTGIVFTGSQWQRHAWAETLVGDAWVPTDPTFGEVGLVNALHIKLYHAPTYMFYQFPQSLENITVLEYSMDDYNIDIDIESEVSPTIVPPKGAFKLVANITNNGQTILVPTYAAQKTVGVDLLSDFRQSEIIEPGETKTIEWEFVAPYGERETYYVFFVGPRADDKYAIMVDPVLIAEGYTELEIKNVYAFAKEDKIIISSEIKNRGNHDYAGVIVTVTTELGTQQQSFALGSGESKDIEFMFPAVAGTHTYEITVRAGNSSTNTFGTISVPLELETKGVFEVLSEFFAENNSWIYFATTIVVGGALVMILLVPLRDSRKIPFEEREEWSKLVKLRKGE